MSRDYTYCERSDCPRRFTCARYFTGEVNDYIWVFRPDKIGNECEHYVPKQVSCKGQSCVYGELERLESEK